ncbi:MAG: hypothetical protein E6F93_14000, partial [Actinobacteria bacterium]
MRQLADELGELGVARHGDIQIAGVERVQPAGQVAHPESAAAVAGELPVVVGRRADVLDRLAHQRRGTAAHFQVTPHSHAIDEDRIETHRQRALELRAERVAHLLERRAADDVEP